jgi:hypothetical protein
MKKKTPFIHREPTEKRKAELAAVLEKVKQRRSSMAAKPKNMNAHFLKPGQFATFEEAFFFFHTERRMTKGAAIKQAVREYPGLHDNYVLRLEAGATLPLNVLGGKKQ